MYGGRFMKNFHYDTICNILQESQELQRFNCACGFISKSAVSKYYQLLTKVIASLFFQNLASPQNMILQEEVKTCILHWPTP